MLEERMPASLLLSAAEILVHTTRSYQNRRAIKKEYCYITIIFSLCSIFSFLFMGLIKEHWHSYCAPLGRYQTKQVVKSFVAYSSAAWQENILNYLASYSKLWKNIEISQSIEKNQKWQFSHQQLPSIDSCQIVLIKHHFFRKRFTTFSSVFQFPYSNLFHPSINIFPYLSFIS